MAITTFCRYEKKYLVSETQRQQLLPLLLEHMVYDAYCPDGADYAIYNVYYDTPDHRVIRKSLAKPYYKEKLRMRSYTCPAGQDDRVFLEIKKKIDGIVSKRRAVLTLAQAEEFVRTGRPPGVDKPHKQQVLAELAYFLDRQAIVPAVFLSYRRQALFDRDDPSLRVTFDHHIRTRREDLSLSRPDGGRLLLGEDQFILEIKLLNAMPLWLARTLSSLRIYPTNFSKYGTEYRRYITSGGAYYADDARISV